MSIVYLCTRTTGGDARAALHVEDPNDAARLAAICDSMGRQVISETSDFIASRHMDGEVCIARHYRDSQTYFACIVTADYPLSAAFSMMTSLSAEKNVDLSKVMSEWSRGNLIQLRSDINEVKGIMLGNISVLLDRGEKLEVLRTDAENLLPSASVFLTSSKKIEEVKRCELLRTRACLVSACVVALLLCGGGGVASFFILHH